ncbi:hypothetical protein COCSADRAFT_310854 [Bipolaris sorokiniana ND90Pr]|uniref:C2H2-type domain-containing protein n=1 Tax=Cochliobolus sativus (strain ND90Pr / ATCC 201652) TaxID=665912 RepID=M2TAH7_COCSN|nr:uncharacterized protein COCSADRAFT_310854 [Bipolaris sorokiniana ND90Pr]EMD65907.1 hypothetical protein COCSADRAFT_310854 [Bipolaris sorokiniana ND90Pr]
MQVCGGLYVGDPDTQVHVYLHHVLELGVCDACVRVKSMQAHLRTHTYTHTHTLTHSHTHTHRHTCISLLLLTT